jgi:phage gp29-like protein
MASSRILGPDGQPFELDALHEEVSAPSTTGIRQVWHGSVANNLTPQRLARILSAAADGDAHQYLTLAEEMEERDMHYASVLGTRKLAIVGLQVRVDSASDDKEDIRRADAVRELIDAAEFSELCSHLVDALGKGYAVSEIVWDRSGKEWMPKYHDRDPRFFNYDRATGRELRLLDEQDAFNGLPLGPFKFIVHQPRIRSGLPIRGGLARLAAPSYMCKSWSWKDWMAFADIFGLPMRIGRYGPNTTEPDIRKLINAIANLGSDAAAAIPDSVKIEFQQAAQVGGAGDFFEKLVTFWDKQVSKGVLGQTMTADDGASLSQARVHNDVRMDLLEADARTLSNTLNRHLVHPFVSLNFGQDRKFPKLTIVTPEVDNTAALVDAVNKLVPLGLRVEQSVMRDKLNIPDPAEGGELLAQPVTALPVPPAGVDIDPAEPAVAAVAGDVQSAALNGAQVTALRELLNAAARKEIPLETARAMIAASFPTLTEVQIGQMVDPLRNFELPEPVAPPAPALNVETLASAIRRAMNNEPAPAPADPIYLGVEVLARAVDPMVQTWVDVMREQAEQAGSFDAFVAWLDERAPQVLSTELATRQIAQGMAVVNLAARADIQRQLEEEIGGGMAESLNAEQAGGGIINRGWQPAAEYFLRKINVPTARWDDLWQEQHARAFSVAGAMRADLLADLRAAVAEAVEGGGSYDQFHQRFEEIVARRGWTGWTGEGTEAGRAWRTRTIYQTNLSTAQAAGRYTQMTDPATLEHMPYWQYRHNTVNNPRAAHKAWDGLVLRWDDPWWNEHYPPNDWGCNCDVRPVSDRMLRRMGKAGPDRAPEPGPGDPPPEWAYHVGRAPGAGAAGRGGP